MGYKTEINYILKSDSQKEDSSMMNALKYWNTKHPCINISKSGLRTYILNSPIMFANSEWKIIGMCKIIESRTTKEKTKLKAIVLTVFSEEESVIVSKLIQEAEKVKNI